MAGRPGVGKARAQGNIEQLRSGALRVRVYAGIDPVTRKPHNFRAPHVHEVAEAVRAGARGLTHGLVRDGVR